MHHPRNGGPSRPTPLRNENPPTFSQITLPSLQLLLVQVGNPRLRLERPAPTCPWSQASGRPSPCPALPTAGVSPRPGTVRCASAPPSGGRGKEGWAGRGDSAERGPPLAPTPDPTTPARLRPHGSSSSPALRSPARQPAARRLRRSAGRLRSPCRRLRLRQPPRLYSLVSPPPDQGSPSHSRGSLPPRRGPGHIWAKYSAVAAAAKRD